MNIDLMINQRTNGSHEHAFTLIELIGILAVLAILAAILVPSLTRQMDKVVGEQESASLKSFSDSLQQSILRNRYIPAHTNWASVIATELGVDVSKITTNSRNGVLSSEPGKGLRLISLSKNG